MTSGHPLAHIVKAYDIRGVVPDQLDAAGVAALGAAFADVIAHPDGASAVVVGHDMRPSSPELAQAFATGAAARGVDVVVLGLTSTDGLYYASGALGLPGVMLTASHNPARYNGLKLCRAGARPISLESGLGQVRDLALAILDRTGPDEPRTAGSVSTQDITVAYGRHLRKLVPLDRIRPLKVVVDAGNGMAGHTVPVVLTDAGGLPALPLEIVPLYFELDGTFPNHEANPLEPANLVDLQRAVVAHGADLGLAFDGDADRCFVVDERGEPVSPSAVTALVATREVARAVASGERAEDVAVVYNVISSATVHEVLDEIGARGVRTRVGHSFIKAVMAQESAVFGGEHSAHYYFRDNFRADSGIIAALLVLEELSTTGTPLSELRVPYERYAMSGEINTRVDDPQGVIERVATTYADAEQDRLDGLTVDLGDWWFNLRASNTEPLLRLNLEAADRAACDARTAEVLALVRSS